MSDSVGFTLIARDLADAGGKSARNLPPGSGRLAEADISHGIPVR